MLIGSCLGEGFGSKLGVVELVLVRHAESTSNAEFRWQGQTDVSLSEKGRGQAKKVCERLADHDFDRVFCSDLSRTRQTLEPLGVRNVRFDSRLREIRLGAWEGLLHSEVHERFPDELRAMLIDPNVRLGGDGESQREFDARIDVALGEILKTSQPDERVLVVTHGGVIRSIVTRLLGVSGRGTLVGARNTSLTRLVYEAQMLRLAAYNCIEHVGAPDSPDDEVLGADNEPLMRVLAHLDIPAAAGRLVSPARGTRTVLVNEPARQLRAYAVPAL